MSEGNTYELFIQQISGVKVPIQTRVAALMQATFALVVSLISAIGKTSADVENSDYATKNGFSQIEGWLTAGGCPGGIVKNVAKVAIFAEARGKNLRNTQQSGSQQYQGNNALLLVQLVERDANVKRALEALSSAIATDMRNGFPIEGRNETVAGTHNNLLSALLIGASGKAMMVTDKQNVRVPCVEKVTNCMPKLISDTNFPDEGDRWMAIAFGLGSVRASMQLEATGEMIKDMKYKPAQVKSMVYPATMSYDVAKDCGVCTEICEYNNWRLETIYPVTREMPEQYYAMKRDPEGKYQIKRCLARCWVSNNKGNCVAELKSLLKGVRFEEEGLE